MTKSLLLRHLALVASSALFFTACGDDSSSNDGEDSSSDDSADDDPSADDDDDDDGPTTDPDTTGNPDTTGGPDDTTGGPDDTTGGPDDTTTGPDDTTTGPDDTTDEGTTDETTGGTTEGTTEGTTGEPLDGFADCAGNAAACTDTEECLFASNPGLPNNGTVCSQSCAGADECPAQPGGGTAPTACADLLGDGTGDCYISCENGETCPDGMLCAFDLACIWPTEWSCNPQYFGTNDGCDCGCFLPDPDCADATVASCQYCGDPGSCSEGSNCPGGIDPVDNSTCDPLLLWTCDPTLYGDGLSCDCGCGVVDPDCADGSQASCDECNGTGSCAEGEADCDLIVDDDNAVCGRPGAWTCDPGFFGDGFCDCGCGAVDSDCADNTGASCEFCNDVGSCSELVEDCPGIIDPLDNSTCDPLILWTCAAGAYSDGATCDCGCGIVDPDCADATEASCDECNGTGSCAEGEVDCATIEDNDNAVCEPIFACVPLALDAELDGTEPTFNRPLGPPGPMCTLSGVGTAVSYDVYDYDLTGAGPHDLEVDVCNQTSYDSVVFVYQAPGGGANPFNPASPCTNLVGVNDDSIGCAGNSSLLNVVGLEAGTVQVVVSSFDNDATGTYTGSVSSTTCQ